MTTKQNDFDKAITENHERIATEIRKELGDKACPELVAIRSWARQIDEAVSKVERLLFAR